MDKLENLEKKKKELMDFLVNYVKKCNYITKKNEQYFEKLKEIEKQLEQAERNKENMLEEMEIKKEDYLEKRGNVFRSLIGSALFTVIVINLSPILFCFSFPLYIYFALSLKDTIIALIKCRKAGDAYTEANFEVYKLNAEFTVIKAHKDECKNQLSELEKEAQIKLSEIEDIIKKISELDNEKERDDELEKIIKKMENLDSISFDEDFTNKRKYIEE